MYIRMVSILETSLHRSTKIFDNSTLFRIFSLAIITSKVHLVCECISCNSLKENVMIKCRYSQNSWQKTLVTLCVNSVFQTSNPFIRLLPLSSRSCPLRDQNKTMLDVCIVKAFFGFIFGFDSVIRALTYQDVLYYIVTSLVCDKLEFLLRICVSSFI